MYQLSPVKRRLSTNDNFKSFFDHNLKETKKIDTHFLRKNSFLPVFGETITKMFKKKKENETNNYKSNKMNKILSKIKNVN